MHPAQSPPDPIAFPDDWFVFREGVEYDGHGFLRPVAFCPLLPKEISSGDNSRMKVLRKVCPHCGFVALFSVHVLCQPGTAPEIGKECPFCGAALSPSALATELDIEEVGPEPDVVAIQSAIDRYV